MASPLYVETYQFRRSKCRSRIYPWRKFTWKIITLNLMKSCSIFYVGWPRSNVHEKEVEPIGLILRFSCARICARAAGERKPITERETRPRCASTPKNSPTKLSNLPSPSVVHPRAPFVRKLETPPRSRRFRPALQHIKASIKFVKPTNRCSRARSTNLQGVQFVRPPKFPRHSSSVDVRLWLAYVCREQDFQRRLQGRSLKQFICVRPN